MSETVRLMAVGDINVQRPDPLTLFGDVSPVLAGADVLIGNQEGVVSDRGTPLLGKKEVGSSCVRGASDSVRPLAKVGFHVISLANNHGMDFGAEALAHSIQLFRDAGIQTVGGGDDASAAHAPALLTRGGVRIAVLAYTSVFPPFGYAATATGPGLAVVRASTAYETPPNVPYQPGTPASTLTIPDPDDLAAVEDDIHRARLEADLVVALFHWGVVGMTRPPGYCRELGRSAIDAGADLVLGHHPHVLQGAEFYRDRLICYSLSHFAFEHAGHSFPLSWPYVHDTVIFSASITDGRIVDPGFLAVTMDPTTHDLSMSDRRRSADLASHLTSLSADFGTRFELDGDWLVPVPPAELMAPPRPPAVYRDPSSVTLDAQAVLARAAKIASAE
jgi:poly-gamma-glutamate capsule biosynthesis protein CapA/YwtB (metallophosphatase superfamily)